MADKWRKCVFPSTQVFPWKLSFQHTSNVILTTKFSTVWFICILKIITNDIVHVKYWVLLTMQYIITWYTYKYNLFRRFTHPILCTYAVPVTFEIYVPNGMLKYRVQYYQQQICEYTQPSTQQFVRCQQQQSLDVNFFHGQHVSVTETIFRSMYRA